MKNEMVFNETVRDPRASVNGRSVFGGAVEELHEQDHSYAQDFRMPVMCF